MGVVFRRRSGQVPRQHRQGNGADVRVIDNVRDAETLTPAWDQLAKRSGASIFAFPLWALACLGTEGGFARPQLQIVTVWAGNELVAVGPFAAEVRRGLRHVRFLGAPHSQPNRPVVAPGHERAVILIWEALRRHRSVLRLYDFDTRVQPSPLEADSGWSGRVKSRSQVTVVDTTLELEERLRRDHRDLRSVLVARRRLAEDAVSLEHRFGRSAADVAALLPHLSAIERHAGAHHAPSPMQQELAQGRLPHLLQQAVAEGRLRLFVLVAAGVPLAYMVGLVGAGVVTAFLTGHHGDSRRYNPGYLAMADLYRWAHHHRLPIDFSIGDLQWKRSWSRQGYEVADVLATSDRLLLKAADGVGALRRAAHRPDAHPDRRGADRGAEASGGGRR